MIQNYNSLLYQVGRFNDHVQGIGQIQKIYSTKTTLCLCIRFPGKTRFLYLGRGGGVEGVWEGSSQPESKLRCKDKLLEYCRRHLTSSLNQGLEVDLWDRILIVPYIKYAKTSYFCYFWSGRKAYMINAFYPDDKKAMRVFTNWRGGIPLIEPSKSDLISLFDEVGRSEQKKDFSVVHSSIEDILEKEKGQHVLEKVYSKKEKIMRRKVGLIQGDLKKILEHEDLKKYISKGEEQLKNLTEIKLGSFNFKFHGITSPHQKANLIFERIKKLKGAQSLVEERLKKTEHDLENIRSNPVDELEVKNLPGPKFQVLKTERVTRKTAQDWDEFRLNSFRFAIGKSAHGNDDLRSTFSHKEDWWMHLDQKQSAHLVLKASWPTLSPDEQNILASALLEYSGIDISSHNLIPIIYTQVKNLKGVKGAAGSVIFKKEKRISLAGIKDWRSLVQKV